MATIYYDKDANWRFTFGRPGTGPGEFNTPHGLWLDTRAGKAPSLVVADRANKRLQWFTLEGQHLKTGERFGLIRFGSRTDLFLPKGVAPLVAVGQRMIGGETVMADLSSTEGPRRGEER